ncbi:MAG TPA: hypothetical protein VM911_19610 [Pyrinomonadaceae bacterium]|jgi:hypothetical protein|nr:hypothetical protein [Pyrinomonadaceae bacterium]
MKDQSDVRETVEAAVDPRITYPCYKSFDPFIDVERLKSLDGYISERIKRHIAARQDDYFLNAHRLDASSPHQPGVREIWLTRTKQGVPYNYLDLDKAELWWPTEAATEFSLLMDFIATLPFKTTGRMLIIYDNERTQVPAHRDHLSPEVCNDFIWLRTSLNKPLYLLNHRTRAKLYVASYSAWFDTVNQFHGSDAREGLSFSIRVDGRFTDDFRKRIPTPAYNLASTPALWACASD